MLSLDVPRFCVTLFFFHDPPTTEIYTLSLHDALPILQQILAWAEITEGFLRQHPDVSLGSLSKRNIDRKSTRLNSSHTVNSYAVFCLKKKTHIQRRAEPRLKAARDGIANSSVTHGRDQ